MEKKLVAELDGCDFIFLSDSQDVDSIRAYAPDYAEDFDSFLVKLADGDYAEIWGIHGIVPDNDKIAYRIR